MSSEIITASPRPLLGRETVEELSRRRREPDWLLAVRLRALEAHERLPVPDQRTEGWRRTSLRGLPIDTFAPLARSESAWHGRVPGRGPDPPTLDGGVPGEALARKAGARLFAYRDGVAVHEDTLERGCVMDLRNALQEPALAGRIEKHFAQIVAPEADKFTALHYAFFNAGVVIFVPRGTATKDPLWVSYEFSPHGPAPVVHTLVLAEDDADVRLVEEYGGGGAGVASGVVEQVVGANAHVRYVHLQRFAFDVWDFSTQRAHLAQDASLRTLNVTLGGRLARNSVQIVLEGRGSQADLLGIVDARARQHVDFQTLQDHFGDATRSDLVIHDALRDRSSANFTGLIRINKSAHQTESSQEQKNILLSDSAKADSDPKLEILNNDVIRCTHGAAVGPVDQEMVFYLQSRGLERAAAEQLIVEGFFQSVLTRLDLPAAADAVWSAVFEAEGTGA